MTRLNPRTGDPLYVEPDLDAWEPNHRPSLRRGLLLIAGWIVLGLALGFVAGRVSAASDGSQLTSAGFAPVAAPGPSYSVSGPITPYPAADVLEESVGGTLESDGGGISSDGLAQGRTGVIAQSVIGGPNYLAIPIGPGHLVDVCGPADCWRAVSTDAGPARSMLLQGRIADVALGHWRDICGLPAIRGTCHGSWHVVDGPRVTLPPTDR